AQKLENLPAWLAEAERGELRLERLPERARRLVALLRVAGQRLVQDVAQRAADGGPRALRRGERAVQHAPQHLRRVLAVERQLADQRFVQQHAQAEYVGARAHLTALDLLGRHVRGRAEHLPGRSDALGVEQLGDAKIRDFDARRALRLGRRL